ncbi:hypothetical protein PR048_020453 [Dryococelus australis]|uniref:Uncharacterized protein n=1 Tax=Dryococelus australis TaxID=614101 RepID=A0ABQ9H6D5_9NEOP|nr:hypothetical protein PR048_020453 [Dryococelus australis]
MVERRSNPEPFEVIMASKMIKDWNKGLAKCFSRTPTAKKKAFCIQKYVILNKVCEGMVCNKHNLNLLKASRPALKCMKPKNAQWLQNLVDGIRMDD